MDYGNQGKGRNVSVYEQVGSFDDEVASIVNPFIGKPFPDLIFKLSKTGTILDFKAVPDLGHDFNGKPIHKFFDPKLSDFFSLAIAEALNSMASRIIQYPLHIQENQTYWFEGQILPINNKEVFALVKDITFEKLSENELIAFAKNSRAILDASTNGMLLMDMQGTIIDANQMLAHFMGLEKEQLMGADIFDILPESFKLENQTLFEEIKNSGNEYSGETFLNKRWISYKVMPLSVGGMSNGAIVIFGRDITLEKHAKEGLMKALKADKENKDFLEQLINSIPDIIGIQERDHRMIRYNSAGYRFLGLTPEEVAGKKCYELIGRNNECVPCACHESYATGCPASQEQFSQAKGIWFDVRSYPVLDDDGEIKFIIEHLRDITELKKSQNELTESRQRYWDLFNSSAAGILLGSAAGIIIEANEYFCQMTGYSRNELIGRHIGQSLFTEESLLQSPFRFDVLSKGKSVSSKRELKTANGSIVPIEMFTRIMPDKTYQSIYYDLTERKLAEEEISRQNEELKSLNAEKDRLFSIIAHDLRSPFTAILGLTEMISDEFDSMNRDEVKDILKELHKSANNLYSLLDNLLEWAMIRRNKKPFNPTEIVLKSVVTSSVQTLLENARAKSINVFIDIEENLQVYADKNMLEVILRNLFSNATKFTYNDGQITISAEQTSDDYITIRVTDTGMGMPHDMLMKIFSVSDRNNRRGTRGESSCGLGLLLSKDFVEKNGGSISAESIDGKGSTFSFTIPAFNDNIKKTKNDQD